MKIDEAAAYLEKRLEVRCFPPWEHEAIRTLLNAYEAATNGAWISADERTPMEGEIVEITRMPKVDRARYSPSRNQFFPWSLIDWPTQGIAEGTYSRLREAVTHWKRVPEPGASDTKEENK